jgi:AcrR family transcriptional regulator
MSEVDEARVRERLLEAATELAAARGFETCGLREIAARARVSPAMVSYYFGDREGLGEALYKRAFERVSARIQTLIEAPDFERRDSLDELVELHVAAMTADPWLPKLIASELLAHGASPLRSRLFRDLTRGPLMTMVGWLEEEQRQGRLRADVDARWMAISIASVCAFPFLILPIVGRELGLSLEDGFSEKLVAHTQRFLAHGLRTRSEDLT